MTLLVLLLGKTEGLLRKWKHSLMRKKDKQYNEVKRWYAEDPYALKRITFDNLNESSVIFDLGGYRGEWSSDIFARYCSNIFIFEPVRAYANIIEDRFKYNSKIKSYPFGLAEKEETVLINIDEFASSILTNDQNSSPKEQIQLTEFNRFLNNKQINFIDLIKINIEGAEYNLLKHIISSGSIKKLGIILIQFHNFIDNAEKERQEIQLQLSATHKKVFDYPFVWECWKIKL